MQDEANLSKRLPPLHPVCRFTAEKWDPVPGVPTLPAFFLGALSVTSFPYDTFVKLEVCSPARPGFLGSSPWPPAWSSGSRSAHATCAHKVSVFSFLGGRSGLGTEGPPGGFSGPGF